jgi:hypothetical protein
VPFAVRRIPYQEEIMAERLNCWEYKKCGREEGGMNTAEFGVCPAAKAVSVHGIHGGKNGGRCCWVVAGTFCDSGIQGIYAAKLKNCIQCNFYQLVIEEEGRNRVDSMEILAKL